MEDIHFYVDMKSVPIVTNFKPPIYQTFNSANLIYNKYSDIQLTGINVNENYQQKDQMNI